MSLVHYLILGGAALLAIVAIFPSFGSRAVAAVNTARTNPYVVSRSAFRELRESAETLADDRIAAEIVDKLADKRKAEFQGLFAAAEPEKKAP